VTAVKLRWRYVKAFEAEATHLYAQPMDTEQMRDFAAEPDRRDPAGAIVKLRSSSPTIAAIAGIRRAACDAVTGYGDHYNAVRKGADERTARALRAITIGSTAQALKANAFRMLQTL
jgi:hypothetical protein